MNRLIAAVALVGLCVAGCARLAAYPRGQPSASQSPSSAPAQATKVRVPSGTAAAFGVYEPQNPSSFTQTVEFDEAIGQSANLALYFSGWGEQFQIAFATAARVHGAIPLIQIDPGSASMAGIADGTYDAYLRSYAKSVRDYGTPVVIGFAHEPDGFWYPWGYNHVSPAVWIAAWQHVVNVFRSESARNVIWLWTMNVSGSSPYPLRAWWPGQNYVTWTGLDGYFASPSDTFSSLFGDSIAQIRSFTQDPLLIAETAVGPATGHMPADVADMFQGIRNNHLLGLVWFDASGTQYRQNWRLEDHPAALAAFRQAVQQTGAGG